MTKKLPTIVDFEPVKSAQARCAELQSRQQSAAQRVAEINARLTDPELRAKDREIAGLEAEREAEGDFYKSQHVEGQLMRARQDRDAITAKPATRLDVLRLLDPQAATEREALENERAGLAAEIEAIDEALAILKVELDAAREQVMPDLLAAYRPRQQTLDATMWQAADALVAAHHSADQFRKQAEAAGVKLPFGGSHRVGHWYSDGLQDHLTAVPDIAAAIAARNVKN